MFFSTKTLVALLATVPALTAANIVDLFADPTIEVQAAPDGWIYPGMFSEDVTFKLYGMPTNVAAGEANLRKFDKVVMKCFNKEADDTSIEIQAMKAKVQSQVFPSVDERRTLRGVQKNNQRELLSVDWSLYLSTMTFSCGRFCWDDPERRSLRSLTEMFGGETNHRQLVKNSADCMLNHLTGENDIFKELTCVEVDFGGVIQSSKGCL